MRVRLREQRPETQDVMTFVFDLQGQRYFYTAGQFAYFELDDLKFDDPRGKRRHFTLSSSPTENGIVQFTTKLRGFGLKETLRAASPGLELSLEEARGRFVLEENTGKSIVFLGGGIGVTPFRSMLRYATDENLEIPITLLYSAEAPEQLVFRKEFDLLPQENPRLKVVLTVSALENAEKLWLGETGRIDEAKIRAHVQDLPNTIFYTCGPPPMVQAMQELLKAMGVADEAVRVERFTGY